MSTIKALMLLLALTTFQVNAGDWKNNWEWDGVGYRSAELIGFDNSFAYVTSVEGGGYAVGFLRRNFNCRGKEGERRNWSEMRIDSFKFHTSVICQDSTYELITPRNSKDAEELVTLFKTKQIIQFSRTNLQLRQHFSTFGFNEVLNSLEARYNESGKAYYRLLKVEQ